MNPARSVASIGFLPSVSVTHERIRSSVSAEVVSEGMSSTSCMTGAGLKKCTPMTWWARPDTAPSLTIGIEDVLDARIASSLTRIWPTRRNRSSLVASSSDAASTTRSRSARASRSSVNVMRSSTAVTSSAVILPRDSARRNEPSTRVAAALAASALISITTTSDPARAVTSVMPEPISPPPMTPTLSIPLMVLLS